MSAWLYSVLVQTEGKGSFLWSGQPYIYPLNYLLHMGVMLIFTKVFIILFLLCIFKTNQ